MRLTQLQANVLSGPVLRAANIAIVLVSYPVYLRALGFEQYGLWLALSTVLLAAQAGNLGIAQAVAKVVAEEHAAGNTLAIRQYATTAAAILAVAGAVVWAAALALRDPIVRLLGLAGPNAELARNLLPYCGLLSALIFVSEAQSNVLAGLGRMDLVNGIQFAAQAVAIGGGVFLVRRGAGLPGLMAAALASRILQEAVAIGLAARLQRTPAFTLEAISRDRLRRLGGLSAGLFGSTTLSLLLSPFNRVVLVRCAGLEAVPVYEIAFNGAMQIRNVLAAGSAALLPEVSRLGAERAFRDIAWLARTSTRWLWRFGAPLYVVAFVAAGPLLRLWLHDNVRPGQTEAFEIMLAGSFVSLLGTVPYFSLLGLHRGRDVLSSHLIQSLVNAGGAGALWLWSGELRVATVLAATAAGMAASTLYLGWAHARALSAAPPACAVRLRFERENA